MEDENRIDPRAEKPGICGVEFESENYTWVCIRKVHDKMYSTRAGRMVPSNNPSVNHHYLVKKYPWRRIKES